MKRLKLWQIPPLAFLLLVLLSLPGFVLAAQVGFNLALGWIFFIVRTWGSLRLNFAAVASGIGLLVLLTMSLHHFMRWLWRELRHDSEGVRPAWRLGSTLAWVGLLMLMFVVAIATAGAVHQSGWLVRYRSKMFVSNFFEFSFHSSDICEAVAGEESVPADVLWQRLLEQPDIVSRLDDFEFLIPTSSDGNALDVVVVGRSPDQLKFRGFFSCRSGRLDTARVGEIRRSIAEGRYRPQR